jgi:hypothetical protein
VNLVIQTFVTTHEDPRQVILFYHKFVNLIYKQIFYSDDYYYLTPDQNPSLETNSCSAGQQIPRFLYKPEGPLPRSQESATGYYIELV